MKLPTPFIKLPFAFDAERLKQEISQLDSSAWVKHPTDFSGNTSLRLISANGTDNDDVQGHMKVTEHLARCPYIQQVLASFNVVWSRSRLMRLAPYSGVPEHADINYHWFRRVRVHIPIVTSKEVLFHCGGETVHMASGEAWLFDNWRLHRVENPVPSERIHLVADTSGSAGFWQMAAESAGGSNTKPFRIEYLPNRSPKLSTERYNSTILMHPSELDALAGDIYGEIESVVGGQRDAQRSLQFTELLRGFCHDWRQLWAVYADSKVGLPLFFRLRDNMRALAAPLVESFCMRTNKIPLRRVLESRILQYIINDSAVNEPMISTSGAGPDYGDRSYATSRVQIPRTNRLSSRLRRPIIILAAPRSGSTLLFETLASSSQLFTVGGEAHAMIEGLESMRPGAVGVDSNRLLENHCSEELRAHVSKYLLENLHQASGHRWDGLSEIRFLEKTPKNALRVPLLEALFPDAIYVHLWRDPRENIHSIMEVWRSGRWVTYPHLQGWDGPWSLLLPPGWKSLRAAPLAEVAAYQWEVTNRLVMEDLARIPRHRWTRINYAELIADPGAIVRELCRFASLNVDADLELRLAGPLPFAKYTMTPPKPDKWRSREADIEPVIPSLKICWQMLKASH